MDSEKGIHYCKAINETLHEAARALVSSVYAREGYIPSGETVSPISKHLSSGSAETYCALHNDTVAGTVSVVSDAVPHGLPMDTIFTHELNALRALGHRLAEITQFAVRIPEAHRAQLKSAYELEVSAGLLGLALRACLQNGIDSICFTINPKHRGFYEHLGCIPLGDGAERAYSAVNGAPALAYVLDLGEVRGDVENGRVKNFLVQKLLEPKTLHNA